MESAKKIWEHSVTGWICWGVFTGFAIWFWCHTPTTGKAVAWLAVTASLMGSFWANLGHVAKLCWVLLLFAFLYVEMKAIDQDKHDSAKELAGYFKQISIEANTNLQTILEQQNKNFAEMLESQQDTFTTTMQQLLSAQRNENDKFASLLRKQQQLFENQNEVIEYANGYLLPGNDPMPTLDSLGCPENMETDAKDYFFVFGNLTNVVETFPYALLRISDHDVIGISKRTSGLLVLTIDLLDASRNIVARFDENGFEVGPNLFKRHPDKSTLIVEDLKGNQLLKVRYGNEHLITFSGTIDIGLGMFGISLDAPPSRCWSHVLTGIDIR